MKIRRRGLFATLAAAIAARAATPTEEPPTALPQAAGSDHWATGTHATTDGRTPAFALTEGSDMYVYMTADGVLRCSVDGGGYKPLADVDSESDFG